MNNSRHALARLGVDMPGPDFSAGFAMHRAGLTDWDIRLSPLFTERDEDTLEVPFGQAITRGPRDASLGIVGSVYKPTQNEEYVPYLDLLKDELGAYIEYAGEIDGGRQVFVALRLPANPDPLILDRDPVTFYAVLIIDHTGNSAPKLHVIPVHEVTQSLLNVRPTAIPVRSPLVDPSVISNLPNVVKHVQTWQRGLHERFTDLAEQKFSVPEFGQMMEANYLDREAGEAAETRTRNKLERMMEQFRNSLHREGIGATRWGALTALCSYDDHYSPVRGSGAPESILRARRALLKPSFKMEAHDLLGEWNL